MNAKYPTFSLTEMSNTSNLTTITQSHQEKKALYYMSFYKTFFKAQFWFNLQHKFTDSLQQFMTRFSECTKAGKSSNYAGHAPDLHTKSHFYQMQIHAFIHTAKSPWIII